MSIHVVDSDLSTIVCNNDGNTISVSEGGRLDGIKCSGDDNTISVSEGGRLGGGIYCSGDGNTISVSEGGYVHSIFCDDGNTTISIEDGYVVDIYCGSGNDIYRLSGSSYIYIDDTGGSNTYAIRTDCTGITLDATITPGSGGDVFCLAEEDFFEGLTAHVNSDHNVSDGITAQANGIITIAGTDASAIHLSSAASSPENTICVASGTQTLVVFYDTEGDYVWQQLSFYVLDGDSLPDTLNDIEPEWTIRLSAIDDASTITGMTNANFEIY